MKYSDKDIRYRMDKDVVDVVMNLSKYVGGKPQYWLELFQKSHVYKALYDKTTHLWSESTIFIAQEFMLELGYDLIDLVQGKASYKFKV